MSSVKPPLPPNRRASEVGPITSGNGTQNTPVRKSTGSDLTSPPATTRRSTSGLLKSKVKLISVISAFSSGSKSNSKANSKANSRDNSPTRENPAPLTPEKHSRTNSKVGNSNDNSLLSPPTRTRSSGSFSVGVSPHGSLKAAVNLTKLHNDINTNSHVTPTKPPTRRNSLSVARPIPITTTPIASTSNFSASSHSTTTTNHRIPCHTWIRLYSN